jgi:SAM-dependent methyltransferase
MDHVEVGRYWEENADAWTALVRRGLDVYRDRLNTPAFMEMLPEVRGRRGLDIGCGEGHNTRLLAERGARMTGIDISERFIAHAQEAEAGRPLGIEYQLASAVALPFGEGAFDFATGFMSFMDIPETERVFGEAHRVLRPGGFLQFSIAHPCFDTAHRRVVENAEGLAYAVEVGEYFRNQAGEIDEWTFQGAEEGTRLFRMPRFTRTLSQWLNLLLEAGFRLERLAEPCPTAEAVRRWPELQRATVAARFLLVRGRK